MHGTKIKKTITIKECVLASLIPEKTSRKTEGPNLRNASSISNPVQNLTSVQYMCRLSSFIPHSGSNVQSVDRDVDHKYIWKL